ncbi:HAMP domain-containing sensor histidine kinase [Curtobacterium sp. APC 4022]|uniref:sensor histidine kinase n=1 Tax=Curtobacterium sp. APC 4022 TaxID=3035201 RepID=UPI0025B3BF35|nr:HAMP domain-containing sensor histidine kinase [Curtobacterium sp. APC 4022]MDN3477729.1 HAMP domain-containing sensor histidine kinase [Curtobacterium sp. APC 4022]
MRRSLLVRFLAIGIVIVTLSIAGTTWIVSTAVTRRDAVQIDRDARTDQDIVAAVRSWAGREQSWATVATELDRLGDRFHRRLVLLGVDGQTIGDTDASRPVPQLPGTPVDPLSETFADTLSPISTTVAGAMVLDESQARSSRAAANAVAACAGRAPSSVTLWPNGRAVVVGSVPPSCETASYTTPLGPEQAALDLLTARTNECLAVQSITPVSAVELDLVSPGAAEGISLRVVGGDEAVPLETLQRTRSCVTRAWTTINEDLVPPRAYLVTSPVDGTRPSLDSLTTDSLARIAAVVIGLVALSGALVLVASGQAVSRVRRLQLVTERLTAGQHAARAPESGQDEISRLGSAVNQLADGLEQARRQRDQLTADIAHDLRTPLTNIRGWAEAWDDGVVSDKDEVVRVISRETQHLERLIDDLRTVASSDAGELKLQPEEVDLAALLRDTVNAQWRQVPVVEYRGPIRSVVIADPVLMRQVVGNLIDNALAHARPSTVTVSLTLGDGSVQVDVQDDGAGILEDDLRSVFDRLWRADRSRKRDGPGHGLGLTIARRIVELHGGTIDVANVRPHGARFTFRIPVTPPDLSTWSQAPSARSASLAPDCTGRHAPPSSPSPGS